MVDTQLWHQRINTTDAHSFLKPYTVASTLNCSVVHGRQIAPMVQKRSPVSIGTDGGALAPADLDQKLVFRRNPDSKFQDPEHKAHRSIRSSCDSVHANLVVLDKDTVKKKELQNEIKKYQNERKADHKVRKSIATLMHAGNMERLGHSEATNEVPFMPRDLIAAQVNEHVKEEDHTIETESCFKIRQATTAMVDGLDALTNDLLQRLHKAAPTFEGRLGLSVSGDLASCENTCRSLSGLPVIGTRLPTTMWEDKYHVVAWGDPRLGGSLPELLRENTQGVMRVRGNKGAFAALLFNSNGSFGNKGGVISWGDPNYGGGFANAEGDLERGVSNIFPCERGFVAMKDDGQGHVQAVPVGVDAKRPNSLMPGEDPLHSDDARETQDLQKIAQIYQDAVHERFARTGYASLRPDGSVHTNVSDIDYFRAAQLSSGVKEIHSTAGAFAALKENGGIIAWGDNGDGGHLGSYAKQLQDGVVSLAANDGAFAALKSNGDVVCWGRETCGGHIADEDDFARVHAARPENTEENGSTMQVENTMKTSPSDSDRDRILSLYSTKRAFAALKESGAVVTWGDATCGGDSSSLQEQLSSGIVAVHCTDGAFSVMKTMIRPDASTAGILNLGSGDRAANDDGIHDMFGHDDDSTSTTSAPRKKEKHHRHRDGGHHGKSKRSSVESSKKKGPDGHSSKEEQKSGKLMNAVRAVTSFKPDKKDNAFDTGP